MTRTVSPEFRLVAACALAPDEMLAHRVSELGSAGLDWDRVRDLALHHSLLAMTGDRLERTVPGLLPEPVLREARANQTRNLALHLAQARHTARLVHLMAEAGVRTIVLKGVPLARMLYPDHPEWRYSSDIDLLVDPRDVAGADEVLRACGHLRSWPDADMASRASQTILSKFSKDYQYHTADRAHYVELHWRLTLNPHVFAYTFDELYAQTEESGTGFGPVRVLGGPVLPAYLAWHAASDLDHILKWFADVIWTRRRLDEQGIDCEAKDWPPHQPGLPVKIAAAIDALLVEERQAGSSHDAIRICHEMDTALRLDPARTISRLPRDVALTLFLMKLVSGMRAKSWFAWRMLVDPRDAVTVGGRDLPAWTHAAVGPFLALGRYLRRLLG